jgi:uncharacterized protein YkwD
MPRLTPYASRLTALWLAALAPEAAVPDQYQDTREALVERINTVRLAAGVKPVKLSALLSSVAQARADEDSAGRQGKDPAVAQEDMHRVAKAGYEARFISEVEAQADGDVETVVAAWQEEGGETARELVGADYREVGLGVARRNDVPLYVFLLALSWDDFFREKTGALSDLERMRREMLERVNLERAARSLPPLRRHPRLDEAAQSHASDMHARRYYGHDTPEGRTVMDRVQARGYRAAFAGENIARGQYSVQEVMDGWMGSPVHQEHLLSSVLNEVGFGLAFGKIPGGYEIIWVQNFGRLKDRERLRQRRLQ